MARLARLTFPGLPHLVLQRGVNRQAIFETAADRQVMLDMLGEGAKRHHVAIHAYVLMENHFHLLATPQTSDGLTKLMQAVGRSYVRYFNASHHRTGTLWDGRYRSAVVEADPHVLASMVHFDLHPVRGKLVAEASEYPWSSHAHYTGRRFDRLITAHPSIWELGNTPFAREAAYVHLVQTGISMGQQDALTDASLNGWVLGSPKFIEELQKGTSRRLTKAQAGRPRRAKSNQTL